MYIQCEDGYLYCVDSAGNQRWRYQTNSTSGSSPAIAADGTVYLASTDSYVYAINSSGTLKWRGMLGKYATASPNIGSDGTIYVGATNGTFYALRPATGVVAGLARHDGKRNRFDGGNRIERRHILRLRGQLSLRLDRATASYWRYKASNWVDSSPSVDSSGNIYMASIDGRLYSVNSAGGLRWSYAVGAAIHSSPAIGVDGTIYIGCDDHNLYAFNSSGGLKWRYQTGGAVQSSPAVGGDGTIYVGSLDENLYAITPSGTLLWQYYLAGAVGSSPAIGPNGTLYVGSAAKNLYAFTIDRTPPTTPVVVDDGRYTTSATSLHATWSSSDPITGIAAYQYAIGTSAGATNVVGWTSAGTATQVTQTGLALTNGVTYYFAVKSENGAGLWSAVGTSDGITVDYSLPATPVVSAVAYTAVNTSLTASWSSSDPYSGVAQYQYAIGTSPGGANVVGWTSTGTATQATATGLTLANGVTYYFSVKAVSGAGLWSAIGSSSGTMVDCSVPTTPVVVTSGAYTSSGTSLSASWSSSDPYSGIAQYQYAIGTSAGAANVVGWTSAGAATQATATGLTLTNDTAYYFSVKAMSGAGLWSAVGSSSAITVDTSPPSTPVVIDDGVYTTSPNTLHATWSSTDPVSGIVQYQYAIGTSAGGADVAGWTSAGAANTVTRTGLSLTNGVTYYFAVKAMNGPMPGARSGQVTA